MFIRAGNRLFSSLVYSSRNFSGREGNTIHLSRYVFMNSCDLYRSNFSLSLARRSIQKKSVCFSGSSRNLGTNPIVKIKQLWESPGIPSKKIFYYLLVLAGVTLLSRDSSYPIVFEAPLNNLAYDDSEMIKRITALKNIEEEVAKKRKDHSQVILLIHGGPGMGKSLLAKQCKDYFREKDVWVTSGRCKEEIESNYQELVKIISQIPSNREMLQKIYNFLSDIFLKKSIRFPETKKIPEISSINKLNQYVVFIDNVSSFEVIRNYLPKSDTNGLVIITSRSDFEEENRDNLIKIDMSNERFKFSEDEAISLLNLKSTGDIKQLKGNLSDAKMIVRFVDYLPTAVNHIGMYISHYGIRSYNAYMSLILDERKTIFSLMRPRTYENENKKREDEKEEAYKTIISLSIQSLEKSMLPFLYCISVLDNQQISFECAREIFNLMQENSNSHSLNVREFNEMVVRVSETGLIRKVDRNNTIYLNSHSLQQQAIREILTENSSLDNLKSKISIAIYLLLSSALKLNEQDKTYELIKQGIAFKLNCLEEVTEEYILMLDLVAKTAFNINRTIAKEAYLGLINYWEKKEKRDNLDSDLYSLSKIYEIFGTILNESAETSENHQNGKKYCRLALKKAEKLNKRHSNNREYKKQISDIHFRLGLIYITHNNMEWAHDQYLRGARINNEIHASEFRKAQCKGFLCGWLLQNLEFNKALQCYTEVAEIELYEKPAADLVDEMGSEDARLVTLIDKMRIQNFLGLHERTIADYWGSKNIQERDDNNLMKTHATFVYYEAVLFKFLLDVINNNEFNVEKDVVAGLRKTVENYKEQSSEFDTYWGKIYIALAFLASDQLTQANRVIEQAVFVGEVSDRFDLMAQIRYLLHSYVTSCIKVFSPRYQRKETVENFNKVFYHANKCLEKKSLSIDTQLSVYDSYALYLSKSSECFERIYGFSHPLTQFAKMIARNYQDKIRAEKRSFDFGDRSREFLN